MPSFDIVSEVNKVELSNSLSQANKEIANRFDFKGSDARVELKENDFSLILFADDEFKLQQVRDILLAKMAKRGLDVRILDDDNSTTQKISGNKVQYIVKLKQGINQQYGRTINKLIKDAKMKVQSSIQGDIVRVTGTKRDDLQLAMKLIKDSITDLPLNFINFRD